MDKPKISFPEYIQVEEKLEIKYGQVVRAGRIKGKDKLIEMTVIFGDKEEDEFTSVTNLGEFFEPDDFEARIFSFVTNLLPSKLGGVESQVMIQVGRYMVDGVEKIILPDYPAYPLGTKLM